MLDGQQLSRESTRPFGGARKASQLRIKSIAKMATKTTKFLVDIIATIRVKLN